MVYVFGINIPIFEILLVFLVLMAICLALIILELRKLRQLLTEERITVAKFEQDLSRLETDEGKMRSEKINDFVQEAVKRGMTKEQIADVLIKRGWKKEVVDKVLETV